MVKYRIYRYPNGISLNGKEFICDENDDIKLFKSEKAALKHFYNNFEVETKVNAEELFDTYGVGIEQDIPENGYCERVE